MRTLGTLEPVIYFRNHRDPAHPPGYLLIAPYTSYPTPEGYSREYAGTLADVDRLQFTLLQQEREQWEREALFDEVVIGARKKEIYDRLRTRMVSGSTTPYERDFIEAYLQLAESKRDKHRAIFTQRNAYLYAREMDVPRGRAVDKEEVKVDRIG